MHWALFDLIELMVQAGFARSAYTGTGLPPRLHTQGLSDAQRTRIHEAAPVRAYRKQFRFPGDDFRFRG
jgi:hypothetical protein